MYFRHVKIVKSQKSDVLIKKKVFRFWIDSANFSERPAGVEDVNYLYIIISVNYTMQVELCIMYIAILFDFIIEIFNYITSALIFDPRMTYKKKNKEKKKK